MSEMRNLLNWPVPNVFNGELACPVCGAPAVEEQVPGDAGPLAAYSVRCTKCWKAQCTDPTTTRGKRSR